MSISIRSRGGQAFWLWCDSLNHTARSVGCLYSGMFDLTMVQGTIFLNIWPYKRSSIPYSGLYDLIKVQHTIFRHIRPYQGRRYLFAVYSTLLRSLGKRQSLLPYIFIANFVISFLCWWDFYWCIWLCRISLDPTLDSKLSLMTGMLLRHQAEPSKRWF